ncbi:hypothetical protein [Asanoa iriomotensis]|uniref:Uncharacterized protein n=1 Tax=Asanoa iriomotensis TaxID=234613 RepID=A0ABQ4C9I8_9ACTN|nr:hypothetical protein [Asanoa iriomotensis]GIF59427.1 hypothetical protein Air01nite_55220 [Asanoa iriomotensis]
MGRIEKKVAEGITKYYWYPGDKREWKRAGIAVAIGVATFLVLYLMAQDLLPAVVGGTSVTAGVTGVNFGRRDARAITSFPNLTGRAARIAAVAQTGRAAWRGLVHGFGGAAAAVLIMNLPHHGIVADWIMPVVPAVVGALAHQAGMLFEQLPSSAATSGPAKEPAMAGGEGAK